MNMLVFWLWIFDYVWFLVSSWCIHWCSSMAPESISPCSSCHGTKTHRQAQLGINIVASTARRFEEHAVDYLEKQEHLRSLRFAPAKIMILANSSHRHIARVCLSENALNGLIPKQRNWCRAKLSQKPKPTKGMKLCRKYNWEKYDKRNES